MRLIDADKMVKVVLYDEMTEDTVVREMTVADALDSFTEGGCPIIMPEEMFHAPVRHGKWVLEDGSTLEREPKMLERFFCDQCGEMASGPSFWECHLERTNYCPNCGCRMGGGEQDG